MHMFRVSRQEEYNGVLRFCLSLLVQKLFEKNVDLMKKQHFLYDPPRECQNATQGSKIGYG